MITRPVLLAVALGIVLVNAIVAIASAADVRPKPECAAIIDSASVEDANKVLHASVPGATPTLALDPKVVELKDPAGAARAERGHLPRPQDPRTHHSERLT